jgi:DNA-binding XRE family transcriptional regulator
VAGSRLEFQLPQPANFQGFVAFFSLGPKTFKSRKPTPYPDAPAALGDHLRKRRHESGLLQEDAADRLGVNTWTLANSEKGCAKPALRFWPGIIEFLANDPNSEPSDLAQRIQWARRRRGLSLRVLAKRLRVDPDTLRLWECGVMLVERSFEELQNGE